MVWTSSKFFGFNTPWDASIAASSPGQPSVMGLYLPFFRCPGVNQEAHSPFTWCLEPSHHLYTTYFSSNGQTNFIPEPDELPQTTYFSVGCGGESCVRCSNTTSCRQASALKNPIFLILLLSFFRLMCSYST